MWLLIGSLVFFVAAVIFLVISTRCSDVRKIRLTRCALASAIALILTALVGSAHDLRTSVVFGFSVLDLFVSAMTVVAWFVVYRLFVIARELLASKPREQLIAMRGYIENEALKLTGRQVFQAEMPSFLGAVGLLLIAWRVVTGPF